MQGWAMYDWANSVYNLVITTAIFPIFYAAQTSVIDKQTCKVIYDKVSFFGQEFINTQLYDYVFSFSYLIVAILAPLLSGIADFWGNKGRTFLTIMTIAVGTFAVGFNSNMGLYMNESMDRDYLSANASEAQVYASPLTDDMAKIARTIPGVDTVEGFSSVGAHSAS